MGKRGSKGGRGGGGQEATTKHGRRKGGAQVDPQDEEDMMYDDVDRFHKTQDKISFDEGPGASSEDEEQEEGVFDLDVEDDSEDEEDEEEDDDGSEEDEDDDGKARADGRKKGSRGVEMGGLLSDEEESDGDSEDARKQLRQWGKGKSQYYNADATDLEIGQDFAEAEEEEEAARQMEQARYEELDEGDFGLDEDEDEKAGALGARIKGKGKGKAQDKGQSKGKKGPQPQAGGVETSKVSRDLSRLSKAGKLQVLLSEAPELLTLLEEFREKLAELKGRVEPLVTLARKGGAGVTDDGVAYLDVKQQLLLSYCINIAFYMLLKAEGRSVKDHPVIDQLLELRAAMEKIRPLDNKLKYHIDRLLKVAERNAEQDARDPLSFRPNPEALLSKDAAEEGEGEGEGQEAAGGVYRAPRLAAVPYDEKELGKKAKEQEQARRKLEKLRRSEILQSMADQFSERPELVAERGGASEKERRRAEEAEERRRFEEERFVRLATTKKDKKELEKLQREATRLETIADIGDFQDLEASLAALGGASKLSGALSGMGGSTKPRSATDALQRAVNSLAQRDQTKRRKRDEAFGDADVPHKNTAELDVRASVLGDGDDGDATLPSKKSKKRRGQPLDEEAQGLDFESMEPMEEDPLYEEVASRKAQRRQERAALYEVEAQPYAPMEDEALDAGAKRGVTDQILKNRGLTAYKNKLNRNPRVKKREAYRKAVIRRKGQVRDVRESEAQGYGGEATGINLRVVRKRGTGK